MIGSNFFYLFLTSLSQNQLDEGSILWFPTTTLSKTWNINFLELKLWGLMGIYLTQISGMVCSKPSRRLVFHKVANSEGQKYINIIHYVNQVATKLIEINIGNFKIGKEIKFARWKMRHKNAYFSSKRASKMCFVKRIQLVQGKYPNLINIVQEMSRHCLPCLTKSSWTRGNASTIMIQKPIYL